MRNIAVYPYNATVDFLSEFCQFLVGYEKIVLVPLAGTKYLPKNTPRLEITYDIFEAIDESDVVILLSGNSDTARYRDIVKYATEHDKEIRVDNTVFELLSEPSKKTVHCLKTNSFIVQETDEILREIEVPVISVMSLGDNLRKFNLEMELKCFFENTGYRVLTIGSHQLSELFDVIKMPEFMFEDLRIAKKVIYFNHFLYDRIRNYKPDIVIIGCPGGIMPYNRYVHNYFGEIPYIVSKAVPIDINIISTYFANQETDQEEFYRSLDLYCEENYECDLNFFTISNIYMNYNREKNITEYMVLSKDTIKRYLETSGLKNVFDGTEKRSIQQMLLGIKNILETDYQVV